MKKLDYLFVSVILCVLIFSSCRARFYTPNRNPVPLFKDKGDVYIDGSSNFLNKYDLTAGYAITKNIGGYIGYGGSGLKVNSSTTDSQSQVTTTENRRYRGDMLNLGLGYFLNQEESANFRFEIFGDLAMGNYRNSYILNGDKQFLNGNFMRIGIMPNIGFTSNDNSFSIAYSARVSQITFTNSTNNNSIFWQSDLKRLNSKTNYMLLEHALTMRAGGEKLKFQMQFGLYQGLNSEELVNAVPVLNASIMLGLVVNINTSGL